MMGADQMQPALRGYIADHGLETAARVAFELEQPLLLTGEPRTGKTLFAAFLAQQLAPRWLATNHALALFKFDTKSTSIASDLFYRFDSLRRLHAVHDAGMSRDNRDYITFDALGKAILLTRPPLEVATLTLGTVAHLAPERSVVLIDEIDKAPRDFPNDILNEIDQMYFSIPELRDQTSGGTCVIRANPLFKPLVVLTSNSEKNLPPAFLRRCIFHHIAFPEREYRQRMEDIIIANLTQAPPGRFTREALDFFYTLREDKYMEKVPATAELVQWMRLLYRRLQDQHGHAVDDLSLAVLTQDELTGTLGVLVKSVDDMQLARQHAARRYEKH